MRRLLLPLLLVPLLLAGVPFQALAQAPRRPACLEAPQAARIEAVTGEGELVLSPGGLARLAGLRLPEPSPAREAALAWLRGQAARDILVHAQPKRDRWDRLAVRITLAGEASRLDLAHGLLENGLALVDPAADASPCVPEMLALEATARERGLGLWGDDRYKPVAVGDLGRLREQIGRFALVEGPIRGVGERQQQTYLNFGTDWASDFTIILPQRTWSLLRERGLTASTLKGRRVRARGILEDWQGPALTVTAAEALEVLDERPRSR